MYFTIRKPKIDNAYFIICKPKIDNAYFIICKPKIDITYFNYVHEIPCNKVGIEAQQGYVEMEVEG